MQIALITGGYGFLGRAMARRFKAAGYMIVGVGHGAWAPEEAAAYGFDTWVNSPISVATLMSLHAEFDVVIHCAGTGSVSYSLVNPMEDFRKTVVSTLELLEYLRLCGSRAKVLYPSSAAVYGLRPDAPIREDDRLQPISPYGVHKKIAEDLLLSYAQSYDIKIAIIRFFSIYGPGLTKQLLWDAAAKIRKADKGVATFWGTGLETRDLIAASDAADLALHVIRSNDPIQVLNGACGVRRTISEILTGLRDALRADTTIAFNGQIRAGDPRFFHADVSQSVALGWTPSVSIDKGLRDYAEWVASHLEGLDA